MSGTIHPADRHAATQYASDRLTGGEKFAYIAFNICTLGLPFLRKVIMKKALLEAQYAGRLTGRDS